MRFLPVRSLRSLDPRPVAQHVLDWLSEPTVVGAFQTLANPDPTDFTWTAARSILLIKPDDVGDFVLATPFLRELRRNAPRARITLVLNPSVAGLAAGCPYVDEIMYFNGNPIGLSMWRLRRQWRALRLAFARLRSSPPDVAVLLRRDVDIYHATQLAVYSGAAAIVTYAADATPLRHVINAGFDRLATHLISEPDRARHEVESNLALLSRFGGDVRSDALELWPTPADHAFAASALPSPGVYVVIAAGAANPLRCWPVDRFARLADSLHEKHRLRTVSVGAAGDPVPSCHVNLIGQTTLGQVVALLARAHLFIGNDSGVKHIAAAAKTPVVEISALREGTDPRHHNSPSRFHAWEVPYRVVRPPATAPAELAIDQVPFTAVEEAVTGMLAFLASKSRRPVQAS